MIISKAQLITAIHEVEEGNHTRISSLITECYLMRQLKKSFAKGKYSDAQSGWVILRDTTLLEGEETWYRLISDSSPMSDVDWAVVSQFAQYGRRFYSVSYSFKPDHPLPEGLKLTTQELHYAQTCQIIDSREQTLALDQKIQSFISSLSDPCSRSLEPFEPWLRNLDQCELELMLAQRCLMNSIGICLDIDAVALTSSGNQLVFFEFKRKYPTLGGSPLSDAFDKSYHNLDRVTSSLTTSMANLYHRVKNESYKTRSSQLYEQFALLCKRNEAGEYQKNADAHYCGLDWDHVHNVYMCEVAHVQYRYLVWNYKPADDPMMMPLPKKTQRSEVKILERLLSFDLEAIHGNRNFLAATLTCNDAAALSFTEGVDSGIFNDGVRVQVLFCMPEVKFDYFPMTPHTYP